ncbi:MAG: diguanylate cyclase [Chloroflexota bacterium]
MAAYVIGRLGQAAVLLLVMSAVVFAVVHAAPGGPAILNNPDIDPRVAQEMARNLGLEDPLPVQYARWLGSLLRGKLGRSYQHQLPVEQLILERLPATLLLTASGLLLSILLAIPIGILSATRPYSLLDRLATLGAFIGVSIPVFWLGMILIIIFSVELNWLPSAGMLTAGASFSLGDLFAHLLLPSLVVASFPLAQLVRYTRSALLEVIQQDYVRTARAKGLTEWQVLTRHALRNALIPVITVVGLLLPRLVGGAAITETVFAWPGMGRLAVDAAFTRDYPLVMGITLLMSAVVVLTNLLTDLLYVYLDPRIRFD